MAVMWQELVFVAAGWFRVYGLVSDHMRLEEVPGLLEDIHSCVGVEAHNLNSQVVVDRSGSAGTFDSGKEEHPSDLEDIDRAAAVVGAVDSNSAVAETTEHMLELVEPCHS
jgi:hypothetical protein